MMKILLFTLFAPLVSAMPLAETTEIPFPTTVKLSENAGKMLKEIVDNEVCKVEAERFSNCYKENLSPTHLAALKSPTPDFEPTPEYFESMEATMECIGDVKCGMLALSKYMMEVTTYIWKAQTEAKECVENPNYQHWEFVCGIQHPAPSDREIYIKSARCLTSRLQCSDAQKLWFLRAEMAKIDMRETTKPLQRLKTIEEMAELMNGFEKKFDRKVYEDLEL